MCLATTEIKIRGFDFHFSFYASGLEDSLSITDKLNMMHTHMHAQMALCTQKKTGPFACGSAFMRYAFSNYVYSWGLLDDFRNGIQRLNTALAAGWMLAAAWSSSWKGVVSLFLASIPPHRDWVVLFPFLPLLNALSPLPIRPALTHSRLWAKWQGKGIRDKTGTHTSECSYSRLVPHDRVSWREKWLSILLRALSEPLPLGVFSGLLSPLVPTVWAV